MADAHSDDGSSHVVRSDGAHPGSVRAPRSPFSSAQSNDAEPKESWLLRTGLSISVWTLAGVATVLAASGQVQFAHWAGITDVRAYAVPAVLELVAVAFLLIGYRRARRGDSPSALWLLAALVGAFAVYTNVVHTGGRSGLVFGAASAITMILWFVKLRDDYRHFQRKTGQATRPRPKLGALWLVAPRLSTRAWVLAARRRISTVDEAVAYAEVWRAVYEDARAARVRKRLARRTAWRSVAEASGGVWAELPRTAEVAAVNVVARPAASHRAEPTVTARPANGARADLAVRAEARPVDAGQVDVGPVSIDAAANQALLRTRVHDFLDARFSHEEPPTVDDADDPYLLWMTARALGVTVDAVASHVREWCQIAAARSWNGSGPRL
jgi:hypothetical protein